MPLLYGLCDEWTARAQALAALGGKPHALADALSAPADDVDEGQASTPAGGPDPGRAAAIAAMAAAFS
ncbi:hypothetical protein AB0M91_09370 [Micromonospora rifamycinica]|uniref:hypothetical protein n=1 Tax=Micromonospora rifamycinica TaxID=291594 RepID=UPI003434BC92